MKILLTSRFRRHGFKPLETLIKLNRLEYVQAQQYKDVYIDYTSTFYTKDPSWRHPEIILETLKDPAYNDIDYIVNTGQANIVTNFDISIQSNIKKYFNPDKHEMILQSWLVNPKKMPVVLESIGKDKPFKVKFIDKPYLALFGE